MYDKCDACGKWIEDIEDCKLVSHDKSTIRTFCKKCYEDRGKLNLPK
ncbi:MAG: hypothetical protein KAU20_00505 [Nanoarchaeota archaeon]|nr:hypothetical protein [Nanoarchaeota archaeon]